MVVSNGKVGDQKFNDKKCGNGKASDKKCGDWKMATENVVTRS